VAFATVYPLVSARAVARPFTYEVPDDVGRGAIVSVPFGRARVRGVVVSTGDPPPAGVAAAPIAGVLDELPPALVELALWVADYYGSTPARALELVAPRARRRRGERRETPAGLAAEPAPAKPTPEQSEAVAAIVGAMDSGGGRYLLYGPTGSGKTEVYLRACAAALERGLGAIVLVPEIALTPQAVGRFQARFGERIALLHSGLTEAERRDERERIAAGEARVVVGARSAVFAPVRGLGLICVDEEHDASYKQESDPRYDARTVAAKRASLEGAAVVFGSATPRPESWAALERLELGGRLGGRLPPVRIVDLRREQGYPISAPLLAELGRVAENGGKAILLLNRRGLVPAIHCRTCGATRRCPNCDVALVLHGASGPGTRRPGVQVPGSESVSASAPGTRRPGVEVPGSDSASLHCHHCGHAEAVPELCPECGSAELARLGAGTQRLERELAARLPGLHLVRLDADSGDPSAALERFAATDRAVLLGTQMVAKGHHFEGVSLAAVVDADTGLALPDFRAEERTFQLLTQLAGRSGRDAPGRVLIQTFQPDSRPVELAARHDVVRFLVGELERREALGYPPFGHLVRIVVSGPEAGAPMQALQELREALGGSDLLGPAPILRLRGRHRAQLVAKTDRPGALAARAARALAAAAPAMRKAGLTSVVDVDPQSL
jgi:primosomal protein N' (replication factor Y)